MIFIKMLNKSQAVQEHTEKKDLVYWNIWKKKKRHESFNNRMGLVSVSLVEIIYSTEIFFEERDRENSQQVLEGESGQQIKNDLTEKWSSQKAKIRLDVMERNIYHVIT